MKRFFQSGLILLLTIWILAGCVSSEPVSSGELSHIGEDISSRECSLSESSSFPDASSHMPLSENESSESEPDDTEALPVSVPEPDIIAELIGEMSLKEKVGQLFMIRPEDLCSAQPEEEASQEPAVSETALTEGMKRVLRDYPVGGVIMFGKNITDPCQLTVFINDLHASSELPLFVAVDEEGGSVARLAGNSAFGYLPLYESAASVGQSGDPSDALFMGNTIGIYLNMYGFNMDLAPVADVNTNPMNPVIGRRAFSSDARTAAQMSGAMAEGLKQRGIIPVFKHFPGHGDTAEDSHMGIAVNYKTKEEMENCEWLPYKDLTAEDCVMVGHIAVPELTGDLTPSTMSREVVTSVLRQQLGFEGLIITDSLIMGAVTEQYSPEEAALNALTAGCDILLDPENFTEAFDAILSAVANGTLSEERINESVYRILSFKKSYGILPPVP